MVITTKDIKIKDNEPENLVILTTDKVRPKDFVIKGKAKPKPEQVITTSNVKDTKVPLNADEKKVVSDIRKAQAETRKAQKEAKKARAELAKLKKETGKKTLTAKEKKIVAEKKKARAEKKKEA